MQLRANRPIKVSLWQHPTLILVVFVLFIPVIVLATRFCKVSPQEIKRSLILGLCLGLPAAIAMKWVIRKNIAWIAEAIASQTPAYQPKFRVMRMIPLYSYIALSFILEINFRISFFPGQPAGLALMVLLLYPEQKALYETAQARVAVINQQ